MALEFMIRIANIGIDNLGNGSAGSVGGIGSDTNTTAAARPKSDSLNLSNAASLVAWAKSGAASRKSKIQNLTAKVKSGRYQTDTSQVSHAMIENHVAGAAITRAVGIRCNLLRHLSPKWRALAQHGAAAGESGKVWKLAVGPEATIRNHRIDIL